MSSLKDLASLIMVPSLYKDGELHTVKPLGNSILHPDATGNHDGTDGSTPAEGNFTFSRGSNLAATRVDVNGLIEKGRENLFLHSEDVSNSAYAKIGVNATYNQIANPVNGSVTADKLETNGDANVEHMVRVTNYITTGVKTLSVYVKYINYQYVYLRELANNKYAVYDIQNGVVTREDAAASQISTNIESVGNGWYRLSMTFLVTSISNNLIDVGLSYSDTSFAGSMSAGSEAYFYGFQLEAGLVATDYIETGASTAQAGILEDMPRLDYSGSCPALLLEPQRTNKITNSEYINTTTFNQNTGVTINNNEAISPEGIENAAKIIATTANSRHELKTSLATPNGTDMVSCFVKASGYNYVQIASWADPANYVNFDLTDGSIGSVGLNGPTIKDIEDYGNGWYRIHANVQASGGGVFGIGIVTSASSGWAESFTGNGTDGLLIWGVQLEAGSYPTSYIPTYGSSVTRSNDRAEQLSLEGIGNSHTILFNFDATSNTDTNRILYSFDNTSSQVVMTARWSGDSDSFRIYNQLDGEYPMGGYSSSTKKWVLRIDENNWDFTYNNNGTPSIEKRTIATSRDLGEVILQGQYGSSLCKQIVIFPTALTDAECKSLVE